MGIWQEGLIVHAFYLVQVVTAAAAAAPPPAKQEASLLDFLGGEAGENPLQAPPSLSDAMPQTEGGGVALLDLLGMDTPSTSSAANNSVGGSGMNGLLSSASIGGGGPPMGLMGLLDGLGGEMTTRNGECLHYQKHTVC